MNSPSSRHDSQPSRRFISRHQTLLAVLLVLGIAIMALTVGQSWNVSSAKRRSDRMTDEKSAVARAALKRGLAAGNANSASPAAMFFAQFTQEGSKLVGTGNVGAASQGISASLSSDGNTAIVGGYSDNGGAGAAWVFTRSGGIWTQEAKLVGTGATGNASQGWSVSLSDDGNTAIIGGLFDNSNAGAAWVFTRSGGVWTQQAGPLVGSGAVGNASQGISVALSGDGNTALIGGYADDSNTGAAWIFTRSETVWTQQGSKLTGSDAVVESNQGGSVSLSSDGNTALIGGNADNTSTGAAWVFTRSAGVWTQQGNKLTGSGATGNASQGYSVSLSDDGNTALIGGYIDNVGAGAAWVFTRSGGVWTQEGTKLVGSGATGNANQGYSVSLSGNGNTAIIGGHTDDSNVGAAWVFKRSGGVWAQEGTKLIGSGATGNADQGISVALSGDGFTAIIGGLSDNSGAGAAWVFTEPSNAPPTITAAGPLTRQQGEAANSTIATVNDTESGAGGVTVIVTSANPSNGVTVSNIVNTSGTVTADVAASCSATNATFTLQASDGTATATDTLTVNVTATPTPPITPTPAQVCANSTGNTAAGPAGATTYAWSIVNGTITSATNIQTITYTAGASGTVDLTLVVTNASGCSASNTVNVTINASPATPAITPTPAQVCATSTGNSAAGPAGATTYAWSIVNGTITSATNIQTITYTAGASGTVGLTLVVTNASGCSASNTVNVTINPIPATPTITPGGPTTFCAGGSVGLTSSSASGNQWYLNGNPIGGATNQLYSATASGDYTVIVTDNGCGSSPSAVTTVTVNPIPATPTITPGGPTTFCAGGNVTLTSSSASGNQWYLNGNPIGGATNQNYVATASGDYTVTVTASGCPSAPSATTTVTAQPTSITVVNTNDSGAGSLRQAILDVCAAGGNINFDPALTAGGPATITLLSELVINKIVTINGATNNGLTISGNNTTRIFNINGGFSLAISNLTIANGKATTGGGALNAGTLTITNSTFTNNTTTDGADVPSGTAGNGGNGGAIFNTGTLNLINSTLSGNSTGRGGDNFDTVSPGSAGNGGSGAGLANTGTAKVTNCTIANNQTGRAGQATAETSVTPGLVGVGGGIFSSGGTLTLNNTIVATNRDGFSDPDDVNAAVNPASRSNLIGTDTGLSGISNGSNGNQVGQSSLILSPHLGALANNGGPTRTHLPDQFSTAIDGGDNTKALDQNNVALVTDQRGAGFLRKIDGGAAKPDEPTVDIGSVEVTPVAAPPGADLTVVKTVDRDTVVPDRDLTYTIVITNSGADPAASASWSDTLPQYTTNSDPNSPTFGGTTFVSLSPVSGWNCTTPGVGGTGGVFCSKTTDFPGTSSQTFTLVVHVPADAVVNSGDPFVSNSVTVDSTNETNTENNSGFANSQLVSCVTNPIVTTNDDSGPGSLRQAIADACVGSTITFDMTAGHVASPIALTTGELLINKNLTIQGPGANLLTVQRSAAVATPNFHILRATSGTTISISGLTLTNGAGTISGSITDGGAIYNDGTLTLSNSLVTGNTALTGGGIYNHGGALTLSNSTVSNNHADTGSGGGIANGLATLTVINSTISGNSAFRTGGIEIADGTAKIINSTVSGNLASAAGGGIQTLAGTTTVTNVTVTNNHSDSDNTGGTDNGGGIRNGGGTITLRNTIVAGNYKGSGISTANDIDQTVDPASTFNLIGIGGSGGLGNSNGNQVGVANSLLGLLANNGGLTQTHLLLPGSLAINAGSNALAVDQSNAALTTDQRGTGFNRIVNSTVDIGAVEVNYSITATAGTPQSAVINSAFATALKANVKESGNNQVGIPVTFTAPVSGASGTFSGSATVNTDASGVATAPTFTANGTAGGPYNVVASIGTGLPTAAFALTNAQAATSTAVTASPNPSNSGQSVTFTATVTSTAGVPTGTVQFKDGGTNLGPAQALNGSGVATFSTSSLTAGPHTITAEYSGDPNFISSIGTLSGGQQVGATIKFSSATYNTTESSRSATITVQRSGELTSAVTVDYATPDDSAATPTILPCSTPGFVSPRCDYSTAIGTLKFAANETSKTFEILISQDNYVEGSEQLTLTLSNPSGNAALGTPQTATLTIADDVTEPVANPIDDSTNFVRQHYHDFLNREPVPADQAGLDFWVNQIESCGADQACRDLKRVNVSGAFFLSIEFQQTGFYVYRTYKTAFADINPPTVPVPVRYREFMRDTREVQRGVIVGQGAWQTQLDVNKLAYAEAFVTRPEFVLRYPLSLTATQYVDMLNANAGNVLTPAQRSAFISELTPNPSDPALRGDVLMKTAENDGLKQAEMNRAFVLMQYFGYLRRNPDAAPEAGLNFNGYTFWLNKLNSFNGNFVNADMVKAFITSGEYRKRSGQ